MMVDLTEDELKFIRASVIVACESCFNDDSVSEFDALFLEIPDLMAVERSLMEKGVLVKQ